jgi:cell division initiation protein
MALTPLDIQKMRFPQKMRGSDPAEVEAFLRLVAEELTTRLGDNDRLTAENRTMRERLGALEERQRDLQDAMLRAQRVSEGLIDSAKHEAENLVKEAELTGDRIVGQAVEQATRYESRISELRAARKEVQFKLKNTLELYGRILEADMQEEQSTATVHTMPRARRPQSS